MKRRRQQQRGEAVHVGASAMRWRRKALNNAGESYTRLSAPQLSSCGHLAACRTLDGGGPGSSCQQPRQQDVAAAVAVAAVSASAAPPASPSSFHYVGAAIRMVTTKNSYGIGEYGT